MNVKKIFSDIQEKIVLENFKTEARRRRNAKRTIITLGAITVIFAGLIAINSRSEKKEI